MAEENEPKESQKLSLHGMTPEEAIKKAFGSPPPSKKAPLPLCPVCGTQTVRVVAEGEPGEVRCPKCGLLGNRENKAD